MRRPSQRTLNLLFAFFSFAYAGAVMAARAGYLSDTPDQYAAAFRVSTLFTAAGFALLIWYVAAYTRVRPRVLLVTLTAAFAILWLAAARREHAAVR